MKNADSQETSVTIEIALYQPDIAPNTATILRLCACLGIPAHIIEPAGFHWSQNSFRRAGMDYVDRVSLTRQASWEDFIETFHDRRIVLASTKASTIYTDFAFQGGDILLLGRESAGVPEEVHGYCRQRIRIAMSEGMRSLNVAMATAMIAGEALRQIALQR